LGNGQCQYSIDTKTYALDYQQIASYHIFLYIVHYQKIKNKRNKIGTLTKIEEKTKIRTFALQG